MDGKHWQQVIWLVLLGGWLGWGTLTTGFSQPPDLEKTDQPTPAEAAAVGVQVVDDETGQPFVHFAIQDGRPDPDDPGKMVWYGLLQSEHGFRDGEFQINPGWVRDGQFSVRILAEGYLPQPYTGLVAQARQVIRLQRGRKVEGRVLDPEGKPVEGATLFLAGPHLSDIVNGKTEHFRGVRRPTDPAGHFVVWGGGEKENHLVVLAPSLHAWLVPVPDVQQELTISLPEPATLVLRYDIAGDDPAADLRLELKTWEMPDWKGLVEVTQRAKVENQGQLILRNVTPGRYDLSREKTLRVGDLGKGFFLDRRLDLTLESGQTVEVAFVREKGQPIFGQVTGLPPDRVPGVFLQVQAAESPGEEPSALGTTTVEALTCPVNGEFKTARISPGDYLLRAEAYEPEPQDGVFRTGLPVPQFIGTAEVTVPPDGPAPRVRIEMKPGEEAP